MAQGLELSPQDRMLLDSLKDLESQYRSGKISKKAFLAQSQMIMNDVIPDSESDSETQEAEEIFENAKRS